jgi:hypothetical protein
MTLTKKAVARSINQGKDREHDIFSTVADNPFASYKSKLDRTHVSINRFFKGMSYQDIATMLDTDATRGMVTDKGLEWVKKTYSLYRMMQGSWIRLCNVF